MTDAAQASRILAQEELTDSAIREVRPRIQAYAETATGVHAIGLDDALGMFEKCQAARSPDEQIPLVWIDVASPTEAEADFLRDRLHFHPLAVEDCIRGRQRPKLDRYPGYYFMVLYSATINPERNRMALHEVHLFLGRRYIVTVHDHKITEFAEVLARWRASPATFRNVGTIAHAIVDAVIDDYFPILDHFADRVEDLESGIFHGGSGSSTALDEILGLRRELTLFRKVVGPERDLLSTMLRRDLPFVSPELVLYFQDVHDHALRVVEELDTQRDLLSAALEGQLSIASNQLNVTMRVMAAWSIILMGMAWIAGIYGMNFRVMPETQWRWGYPFAIVLMLGIGFSLFIYFRRRQWI